jgi:hypothetical protein
MAICKRWLKVVQGLALSITQQGSVNAGHHEAWFLGLSVCRWQHGKGFFIQAMRAGSLKFHKRCEAIGVLPLHQILCFDIKLFQLINGQIDAATQSIFTHIAQDIGELKS